MVTPTDRKPLEEMANRAATAGAGLAAAAKAVAVADHKRMLDDHARRVRDSHRLQMKKLGLEVNDAEDDEMGDVFVCGDITTTTATQPPATTQPTSAAAPKILPYVLAAALAGGGLGLGAAALPTLLSRGKQPVPAPSDTDTDTQYELRITSGE